MPVPRIVGTRSADPEAAVTSTAGVESGVDRPQILDEGLIASSLHLVRQAGVVLVVQVVGAGVSYGLQVLLARLLHASDYGIYTYVFVWVTFVSLLAGLGFPAASIRFLPVYRIKEDWPRIHGFVRWASRMTFATAIGIALCGVISVEVLHAVGLIGSPSAIVLGAVLVPAFAGSMLYTEMARAGNRVDIAFIPSLVARPALIGLGVVGLFILRGVLTTDAALGATLVAAYSVLAVQYIFTRHLFSNRQTESQPVVELREWFGVGISLLAASAFVVTLMQVDIIIVGAIRGARDAGIYAAASKTATLVAFVIAAVNAAAAPQFASLWALGRREELQRLVTKLAGLIFWPSLAIAVGLAALSGPVLALFGPEFSVARPALLILLVGQVINAAAGSVGYLLTLTGYHREATIALGLSALACILLAAAGVSTLGLVGAALGTTIGFLLWNGTLYWLVVRRLGIYPSIFTSANITGRGGADREI
jgi:O-antigen/teichoic acid export membrane protein